MIEYPDLFDPMANRAFARNTAPDPSRGKPRTGLQVKPDDRWAVPLCRHHHEIQHRMNERMFWRKCCRDPFETAERLFAEFTNQRKDQT